MWTEPWSAGDAKPFHNPVYDFYLRGVVGVSDGVLPEAVGGGHVEAISSHESC